MRATRINQAPHETLLLDLQPGEGLCLANGTLLRHSGGQLDITPLAAACATKPSLSARGLGLATVLLQGAAPFWRVEARGAAALRLAAPWPGELRCFRAQEHPTLYFSPNAILSLAGDCDLRPVPLGKQGFASPFSPRPQFFRLPDVGEIWLMSFGAWQELRVTDAVCLDARLVLGYEGELTVRLKPGAHRAGLPGKAESAWMLAFSGQGRVFVSTRQADEWAGQVLSTPRTQALDVRPE